MNKSTVMRWFAVWLLASVFLSWAACLSIVGAAVTDARLDMVAALQAMGPHPSLGDQAKVFGRLVGTWDGESFSATRSNMQSRCPILVMHCPDSPSPL
jgi:hypothetical protein